MSWKQSDTLRLVAGLLALAAVTVVLGPWLNVSNAAIASTTYLMVVLIVATTSRLAVAVLTSVAAMLALNFFFLPPVGTFTIADPHNWVALFAFLLVSLVASNLSAVARTKTEEALSRRDELARLFDLSRDVLMMTESREALSVLARSIARRFDLEFVAVGLPRDGTWDLHGAGARTIALDQRELSNVYAAAQTTLEFDAYNRTYAGHKTTTVDGHLVRLVPLRVGTKPIGVLAAAGRPVEPGTLDTLAGVVAIAVERAQFLEERKAGELTRQSEQLKTALLASLGHDLRTPLTAIRIAASNIKASELSPDERLEQSDLILAEVERLTRLFQNLLDMARIDAGAVNTESRWTHPSEIVAAARDQVEHVLRGHDVKVAVDPDVPVRVDPRLTTTALAHLLENAAQYSPQGAAIGITAGAGAEGLTIQVRDHGPGIASADLPRLFERFYRGSAAKARTSGTGMGLWIVRGLLSVEGGRVWAENCSDGGAQFTIVVPASVQDTAPASTPA
jgi:two-component system, OmpR family, sensor histidine kinase KdpD